MAYRTRGLCNEKKPNIPGAKGVGRLDLINTKANMSD